MTTRHKKVFASLFLQGSRDKTLLSYPARMAKSLDIKKKSSQDPIFQEGFLLIHLLIFFLLYCIGNNLVDLWIIVILGSNYY